VNYLAHFYLALPTAASRAGNFLGDFITGTPESLAETLPSELLAGIIMHRRIDAFTDTHPNFQQGKSLLTPTQRRFAGIILDMFTDHFLARDWEVFSPQPLAEFQTEIEAQMHEDWEFFPDNAQREATMMLAQNWFECYRSVEGLERSLTGIGRSRDKFGPIAGSSAQLLEHYEEFEPLSQAILSAAKDSFN